MLSSLDLDDTAHGIQEAVNSPLLQALQNYERFSFTSQTLGVVPSPEGLSWPSTAPLEASSLAFTTKTKRPHGVAVLMLMTEVMSIKIPEEKKEAAGGPGGHSHGMEGMY